MSDGLRISADLALPRDAVTETFAILAKRGKGKTYTAAVMAEEMIGAGLPVLIIDPLGVWWGLRASADGKKPGLPVVIFGGEHADVPLAEKSGELIADVVVDERVPAILDLSELSKAARRRFMAPFLERLYHRNREALHVIIDEADMFAPQRAQADGMTLLGAMEDLQRRGRARGIGTTLITQRPAVLNKDVLTQAEVLVVLGMTGPQDVKAIDEWVNQHADPDQAAQVKASLPSLPVGTAWVWSPAYLDLLAKVKIRRRTTFDSSATPKVGERRVQAREFSAVDVDAISKRVAVIEDARKADDPARLRRRISELERELADRPTPEPRVVEVPVLDRAIAGELHDTLEPLLAQLPAITGALSVLREHWSRSAPRAVPAAPTPTPAPAPRQKAVAPRPAVPATAGESLPKVQHAILTVLAQGPREKAVVAILTGYSSKGGGFNNGLGALRSKGYIDGSGFLAITDAGRDALGPVEPLPTGPTLREHWKAQTALGKAHGAVLDVLAEWWPNEVTKAELARLTGYTVTGGGFNNALGRLRALGLIHGSQTICIDDSLMED